jgi:sulfopropanediol 3-dehydrogenase
MLADIDRDGREAVEKYARELDGWQGPVVVDTAELERASNSLTPGIRADIAFAHQRVRDFAQRQRDSPA